MIHDDSIDKEKKLFVSVVIVTFNRSSRIDPCLESLDCQTYPKDNFEVIVVDDGSTDDTAHSARNHEGVRVIRHEVNRGNPSARNTGLKAARGEIIAYIDDDTVADPQWLEYLVQPFETPEVTASGGQTLAYKKDYITERYLSAVGYGNPAPLAFGKSKNPLWRFWIYLINMFATSIPTKFTEVQAVYGCNCAYRTSVLRTIGGFDEDLLANQDTEISTRLRQSGAHIIFAPNAIIHHRHREKLAKLIRQTYRRAEYTRHYYAKENKILPLFPLPLFYIVIAVFLIIFQPIIGAIFIVFGPLVLYIWWPVRAFLDHNLEYFVYGYIQLTLELASILGLVRGKFRSM